jgi:phosphoadenosine phosphosulfate reductase
MSAVALSFLSPSSQLASSHLVAEAAELNHALSAASAVEIIAAAVEQVGREKLAVVSSFGTESAALLKIAADVDPAIPVVFLDTGWLFEETLAYRETLTALLGLKDVRTIHPLEEILAREDKDQDLWFSNPDQCCFIRKVEPLARALKPFDAWINGRKRFQGGARTAIAVVEADGTRLKFNPLANVSHDELNALYATMNLPPHPLVASGFSSIGCMPCTSRTQPGEDPRAGRWRGRGKTECGIHVTDVNVTNDS